MFSIRNLKYKDILDIEQVHIPSCKTTFILGQSGSGKTTLLRMLNKLISPTSGEICYENKDIKDINSVDLRRKIVMLPQNPTIYKGTIKDNLLIGLKFSEKDMESDEELKRVLKMVKLNKALEEGTEKLSGGEKQRLALGRVMLLKPEVFLLDEPSSALDESTEGLMVKDIVSYCKREKKTLIIVTHSKALSNEYAEYIIEVENGKIKRAEEV